MIKKSRCTVKIKKWGNSMGIIIPAKVADELELKPGMEAEAEITLKKKEPVGFGIWKDLKGKKYKRDPADDFTQLDRWYKHHGIDT